MRCQSEVLSRGQSPAPICGAECGIYSTLRAAGGGGRGSVRIGIKPGRWPPRSMANWKWGPRRP